MNGNYGFRLAIPNYVRKHIQKYYSFKYTVCRCTAADPNTPIPLVM
jgi:hypothetical protein